MFCNRRIRKPFVGATETAYGVFASVCNFRGNGNHLPHDNWLQVFQNARFDLPLSISSVISLRVTFGRSALGASSTSSRTFSRSDWNR